MGTRWQVPRDWGGATVAVLASGPSMSQAVAARVRGRCRVIAVNNVGLDFAPWAEVLYAADAKWWDTYRERALSFEGLKVTVSTTAYKQVLQLERAVNGTPYDPRPTHLSLGGNSGYQAACLAAHFGAARILLFGFDMRLIEKRKHYFGDHPRPLNTQQNFAGWINNFEKLAKALQKPGIELINCTPGSHLRGLKSSTLEQEFPCWTPADCATA